VSFYFHSGVHRVQYAASSELSSLANPIQRILKVFLDNPGDLLELQSLLVHGVRFVARQNVSRAFI